MLCTFSQLPLWARESPLLKRGYRRPGPDPLDGLPSQPDDHGSLRKCLRSIFAYWHNETVNIHTHLWGCVAVLALVGMHFAGITHHLLPSSLFASFSSFTGAVPSSFADLGLGSVDTMTLGADADAARLASVAAAMSQTEVRLPLSLLLQAPSPTKDMPPRPPSTQDVLAFASFYLGAFVCLGCSTTFHVLTAHSRMVSKMSNRLDYIGIVFMIVGSFLPALHYGFHCHPFLELSYGAGITILGAISVYLVAQERYTTPAYRTLRTNIFLALGLSAILPTAHLMTMYGVATVSHTMGMYHIMLSGLLYVVGALIYLARFPERVAPGKFDYIGASHQIFHVAILLAAAAHYVGLRRAYTFWHTVEVGLLGNARAVLDMPAKSGSDEATVHAVCQTLERWRYM